MTRIKFTFILILGMILAGGSQADDRMVIVRNATPDIIFQSMFNQYSQQFLLYQIRKTLQKMAKKKEEADIFNRELTLPDFPPYVHGKELTDFVTGDLANVVRETLERTLNRDVFVKGATTTLHIYKLHYKMGRPRFSISSVSSGKNSLDFTFKFSVLSITIDVDKIYVNNHSPGIVVKRGKDNTPTRVYMVDEDGNPVQTDNMRDLVYANTTILDDIYLKIQSQDKKPLIRIDGRFGEGEDRQVLSGSLKLSIKPSKDGKIRVYFKHFKVELFGTKSGEELAQYIEFNVGPETKIGGLKEFEWGRSTLIVKNHNLAKAIKGRKVQVVKAVAVPLFDQIFNLDLSSLFKEKIDGTILSDYKDIKITGSGMLARMGLTNLGLIQKRPADEPQLQIGISSKFYWKDKSFRLPKKLPFPLVGSKNIKKSKDNIYSILNSDESSLALSISQDFINKSILTFLKGKYQIDDLPPGVFLGKKGVFMIFDDDDQGKVVMDLLVKKYKLEKILAAVFTGRTKYYFPLIMKPTIVIEEIEGVPTLVIILDKLLLDKKTLQKGRYGIASNLKKGYLNKFVLKQVRAELSAIQGKRIIGPKLPWLKGVDPSLISLKSDGYGRLNIMVDLDPRHSRSRVLYRKLPGIIAEIITSTMKDDK